MENRNYFSLLCVQLETQLIHANLEGLYIALHSMATIEAKSHSEVNRTKSRTPRQIARQIALTGKPRGKSHSEVNRAASRTQR